MKRLIISLASSKLRAFPRTEKSCRSLLKGLSVLLWSSYGVTTNEFRGQNRMMLYYSEFELTHHWWVEMDLRAATGMLSPRVHHVNPCRRSRFCGGLNPPPLLPKMS